MSKVSTIADRSSGDYTYTDFNTQNRNIDYLDSYTSTGWIDANETWTYASATTFTVSGDVTSKYGVGDKIELTQTTAKYFYIIAISYSSPTTTVTVTGGTDYTLANATITSPYFSKAANPQGFPHWFSYTPTPSCGSGSYTSVSATGRFCIISRMIRVHIEITITTNGSAATYGAATLPITPLNTNAATITSIGTNAGIHGKAYTDGKVYYYRYDGAYVGSDGYIIVIDATYRI